MNWLHEHGITCCLETYDRLPLGVLEDARLWMNVDMEHRAKEAEKARHERGKRR